MRLACAALFITATVATGQAPPSAAQQPVEQPVFRASVEMVSLAAVVRDQHGRFVPKLSREDFEVLDAGARRVIVDLRADSSAPLSVAILIDGSGSMGVGRTLEAARAAADAVLHLMTPARDEVALFTFDTRLIELHDFTRDFDSARRRLEELEAYGMTSLYDAIAETAKRVGPFATKRRAIIVLTDGADTSSQLTPAEVSGLASASDVPVYVLALNETAPTEEAPLAMLARWSGGEYLVAGNYSLTLAAVRQVTTELRHQYVLAFEPASSQGWRRVEVRTRRPGLTVRSRSWYRAGASN